MQIISEIWFETVLVGILVLLFALPIFVINRRTINKIKLLANDNTLGPWIQKHWRQVVTLDVLGALVQAPLVEEAFFRGPSIILARSGLLSWAIIVGVVLNLIFSCAHKPDGPYGVFVAYVVYFGFGMILLICGLYFQSLLMCVIIHAIANYGFDSTKSMLKTLRGSNADIKMRLNGTQYYFKVRESNTC